MIENKLSNKAFLVWGICAIFFLYEFLLRTVMGTFQHPVMEDLNLSSFQFSILSSTVFFVIYGLMQIPVGIIIDHIGLKKSLFIGCITCSLASFGFSYCYQFELAMLFRFLMGFGASFGFVGLLISVYDWMPRNRIAIFIGLSQFIGTMGPMLSAGPLDSLSSSSNLNWRLVFLFLGGFGLLISVLILFFVENNQEKAGRYIILKKPEKISTSISRLLSRSQPWFLSILCTCLYFSIEYLSENEGRFFLFLKGISFQSASYMISISWIGYALGCPLLGYLSDKLERRKIVMQYSSILGLIAILMILYSYEKLNLHIAFFTLGLSASGSSIGFASIAEQFNKNFIGIGFGLNNAIITGISSINAPAIGYLLDTIKSQQQPSLNEYISVFYILLFIAILGVLISFFYIKETFCKSLVEFTVLKPFVSNKH